MKSKKINVQLLIGIVLIIIYIGLISVQPINVRKLTKYDDLLMAQQAESILEGNYLGEYSRTTLIKGIFTPLFISFLCIIKMPFIVGQNILYIFSVLMFINVIKKKINNKNILLILFAILLFNPIMFSTELCRVYRDGLYVSLILFLVSSILGIFLNRNEELKKIVCYYIGLGLSFSMVYICREETIWIMPFVIIATVITIIFMLFDSKCINKIKKIVFYVIPIIIFLVVVLGICALNFKYYGVFQLNQYWSKEFKEAYGAMTRVLPEEEIEKVPVTNETIKRIGDISPLFKEIEPELLDSAQDWASCGDGPDSEIQGGWYHWALMKAMEVNGYFESATKANDFYKNVANEINNACDNGEIKCLSRKRISNTCRFNFNDIVKILTESINTIKYEYTLEDIEIEIKNKRILDSVSGKQMEKLLRKVSNSEISENIAYKGSLNSIKITILKRIKDIYTFANKYIFYISLCLYIILVFRFITSKKELYEEILILTGIFVLYYCRIFVLTFTSNMMWTEAINPMYMATAYLLQFVFSILSIICGTKEIKDLLYKYKKGYKIK